MDDDGSFSSDIGSYDDSDAYDEDADSTAALDANTCECIHIELEPGEPASCVGCFDHCVR